VAEGAVARVKVRLVSLLRDAVGSKEVELELPEGARLGDALRALYASYPRLERLVAELEKRGLAVLFLVNGEAAGRERELRDGDVLTILPPASGG